MAMLVENIKEQGERKTEPQLGSSVLCAASMGQGREAQALGEALVQYCPNWVPSPEEVEGEVAP